MPIKMGKIPISDEMHVECVLHFVVQLCNIIAPFPTPHNPRAVVILSFIVIC